VQVGFADEDGAGIFQGSDDGGILKRKKVAKEAGAARGAKAGGVEIVFERNGNAMKRAEVSAGFAARLGAKGGFGGGCVFQGNFGIEREISVEARIQAADAVEKESGELDGREFSLKIEISKFYNSGKGESRVETHQ
jgi:hypothetical protein